MSRDELIPCLLQLFREYGYDGATLSKISERTGLGKASLYHHFRGGKEEMMNAVLDYLGEALEKYIIMALRSKGNAVSRFGKMGNALSNLYEQGEQPCVFAVLLLGSARDVFYDRVRDLFMIWITEMVKVLREEGMSEIEAREKSEDVAIAIQGSLILAQGLGDPGPFQRVIQQLPDRI